MGDAIARASSSEGDHDAANGLLLDRYAAVLASRGRPTKRALAATEHPLLFRAMTMSNHDDDDGDVTQRLAHRDKFSAYATDARNTARFPSFYAAWVATKMGPQAACLSHLPEALDPTPVPERLAAETVADGDFDWEADTLVRTVD